MKDRLIQLLGFVGFVVLASVIYGLAHDAVTARVCTRYFLPPYHPLIVQTDSPALLALIWGVVATWWAGAILGLVIGAANLLGNRPPLPWRLIRGRVALGLASVFVIAMLLLKVFLGSGTGKIFGFSRDFAAVAITHIWSYLGSFLWAIGIVIWILFRRFRVEASVGSSGRG